MLPEMNASRARSTPSFCEGLFLLRRPIEIGKLIFMPMEPCHVRLSQCARGMLVVRPKGLGVRRHMPEGDFNWFFFPQSLSEVRHA